MLFYCIICRRGGRERMTDWVIALISLAIAAIAILLVVIVVAFFKYKV